MNVINIYFSLVPDPTVVIFPPGPIQGAMIGSPQAIECIVSTVSGVELTSVMINWMGPDGNLITDNSRIIVNPITSFSGRYIRGLHFIYLMEGDEGMYTCNVKILETVKSSLVEFNDLACKLSIYSANLYNSCVCHFV